MKLVSIRMHPDRLLAFVISGRHHSLRLASLRFLPFCSLAWNSLGKPLRPPQPKDRCAASR